MYYNKSIIHCTKSNHINTRAYIWKLSQKGINFWMAFAKFCVHESRVVLWQVQASILENCFWLNIKCFLNWTMWKISVTFLKFMCSSFQLSTAERQKASDIYQPTNLIFFIEIVSLNIFISLNLTDFYGNCFIEQYFITAFRDFTSTCYALKPMAVFVLVNLFVLCFI